MKIHANGGVADAQLARTRLTHFDGFPQKLLGPAGLPEHNGPCHDRTLIQPNGSGARRSWIASRASRRRLAMTVSRGWDTRPSASASAEMGITIAAVPQAKISLQRPEPI